MNSKQRATALGLMSLVLLFLVVMANSFAGPFSRSRGTSPCANGQCQNNTTNSEIEVPFEPLIEETRNGIERALPTAALEPKSITVKAGESVKLVWKTTNSKKTILAAMDVNRESTTTKVEANGELVVTPKVSTLYRLFAKKGLKTVHADSQVTVEESPSPDPLPPTPEPTPGPLPPTPAPGDDASLCVVAFGDAFALSDTLSLKARSKEITDYLTACSGSWLEISEDTLKADHHKALDYWWKEFQASGKKQPCIATYQRVKGKVTNLAWDEVSETTDLMLLLKSRTPAIQENVVIHGKRYALGYKKTPVKKRGIINGQKAETISALLTPKTIADIPSGGVNLGHLMPFLLNQGSYGTCVSQATVSGATAAGFVQFGKSNLTVFSPNFLATRIDGWNGAWAEQAIEIVLNEGILPMDDQPNYVKNLPLNWKAKAAKHKAIGVYRSPSKDSRGYIIAALLRGYPVIAAIGVGNGFEPDSKNCIGYRRGATSQINHEIVVCGCRVVDGNLQWLIKNSWGNWGANRDGYAWLVEDSGNSNVGWISDADTDVWVIVRMSASDDYKFDLPPSAPAKSTSTKSTRVRTVPVPKVAKIETFNRSTERTVVQTEVRQVSRTQSRFTAKERSRQFRPVRNLLSRLRNR